MPAARTKEYIVERNERVREQALEEEEEDEDEDDDDDDE